MRILFDHVEFHALFAKQIERTAIYSDDKSTYLWTDWRIEIDCIYNPGATSFTTDVAGTPVITPPNNSGVLAPFTDVALRHFLAQPRRRLLITDDPAVILLDTGTYVDGAGVTRAKPDCTNGPRCTVQSIERLHGSRTYQCRLVFECSINECESARLLLAHRWAQSIDINQDHFQVVHTQGQCVFNQSALIVNDNFPDQLRSTLMHPIPANFRRCAIKVEPGSDGYTYNYYTMDVEQPFNLGTNFPAVRIEAMQEGQYNRGGTFRASVMAGVAGLRAWSQGGTFSGLAPGAANAALHFWKGTLPKYTVKVTVRAWGNRNSTRDNLRDRALAIMAYRMSLVNSGDLTPSQEFYIQEDLVGRYVEVSKTIAWSINTKLELNWKTITNIAFPNSGPGVIGNYGEPLAVVGPLKGNEKILAALGPNTESTNPSPHQGAFGAPSQGRLIAAISQALSEPCAAPPSPRVTYFNSNPAAAI